MSTLLNPAFTAAFDEVNDRIVITFRDGRDGQVVELDPLKTPELINALMEARSLAKQAAKRKATPPPAPAKAFVRHPDWTRRGSGARR